MPPTGQQSHASPPEQVPPPVGSQKVVASTLAASTADDESTGAESIADAESTADPASVGAASSADPESGGHATDASRKQGQGSPQGQGPLQCASMAEPPTSMPESPLAVALLHPTASTNVPRSARRSITSR
jgi:hypothetical protein